MKVKMLETFQEVGLTAVFAEEGFEVSYLEKGEVYIVSQQLGEYLLANRKAEEVVSAQFKKLAQPVQEMEGEQTEPQQEKPKRRSK